MTISSWYTARTGTPHLYDAEEEGALSLCGYDILQADAPLSNVSVASVRRRCPTCLERKQDPTVAISLHPKVTSTRASTSRDYDC